MTISGNFEHFKYLTLKEIFKKAKTFYKTLEYWFLFESYKTAMSEANVKTNRIVSKIWTYHKERSYDSNYFTFLKILSQFKNLS